MQAFFNEWTLNMKIFLHVTPCNIPDKYSYFVETFIPCLEHHLIYFSEEGSRFIQKAVHYLRDIKHHIPQGCVLHTAVISLNLTIDVVYSLM